MEAKLFDGLIGHKTIARILQSSIAHPANAYLFVGQPHVGKRAFAERFVGALLESGEWRVESGKWRVESGEWKVESGSFVHPDLIILEPEEGKKQISVEQVRDAKERLSMRPMVAPRVVAFLPVVDRLNESGMNALLKVLEEPPAGAVFVMIAGDVGRLPSTVLSRSVSLSFDIVPKMELIEGLIARGMSRAEAETRAMQSRGCPGLAVEPPETEQVGSHFVASFFSAKTLGARLRHIEELAKACESSEDANAEWRDALLSAMQSTSEQLTRNPIDAQILGLALLTAIRFIGGPLSPRLALEAGALRLSTSPIKEVRQLFPSHVPRALPLLYADLVQ